MLGALRRWREKRTARRLQDACDVLAEQHEGVLLEALRLEHLERRSLGRGRMESLTDLAGQAAELSDQWRRTRAGCTAAEDEVRRLERQVTRFGGTLEQAWLVVTAAAPVRARLYERVDRAVGAAVRSVEAARVAVEAGVPATRAAIERGGPGGHDWLVDSGPG